MFVRVLKYCKSERIRICTMIALKVGISILTIAQPLIFSTLIDCVMLNKRLLAYQALVIYGFVHVFRLLFTYFYRTIDVTVSKNINYFVKSRIVHYLYDIPYYNQDLTQGKMHSLLVSDAKAVYSFLSMLIAASFTILTALGVGIVTFLTDWKLTLVLIIPYPFIILVNHFFRKKVKEKTVAVITQNDAFIGVLKKTLGCISEVQNQCGRNKITNVLEKESDVGRKCAIEQGKTQNQFNILISVIGFMGNMAFTLVGISQVLGGYITLGKFVAFSSYSKNLSSSLDGLINLKTNIQPLLVSLERLLILEENFDSFTKGESNKKELSEPITTIELDNVGVSFNDIEVFQNISIQFQRGEIIGIIGGNGSGKTTLSNLIARTIIPDAGCICVNGEPIESYQFFSYAHHIGYIGAHKHLYPISIKDNILFAENCCTEEFSNICQMLGIDEYVCKFASGYDTVIDESVTLSTGQIQKIQIAKTLIKQCDVLIIDESTSNLDEKTKKAVFKRLKEIALDKIIIFISHTHCDYEICDRVYRIEHKELKNS